MRSPCAHNPELILVDDIYKNPDLKELLWWQDRVSRRIATVLTSQQIGIKSNEKYKYIIDRIIRIAQPLFFNTERIQKLHSALMFVTRLAIEIRYQKSSFEHVSNEVHSAIDPFLYLDKEMEIRGTDCTEENWKNRKTFNSLIIYFLWLIFRWLNFKFIYDPKALEAEEYEIFFKEVDYSHLFCQKVGNKVSVIINNLSVLLVPNDPEFDGDVQGVGLQVSWCVQTPTFPSAS